MAKEADAFKFELKYWITEHNYILKLHTWGPVNFLTLLQQHWDRYMYIVVGIVLPNFDNRGRVG